MKERIASKIYTSMTGESPFDDIMDEVGSVADKISFRVAEEEIKRLEDIELADRIHEENDAYDERNDGKEIPYSTTRTQKERLDIFLFNKMNLPLIKF